MWVFEEPIRTERLLLRPFRDADLDDLHAMQSREEVVRYVPFGVRSRVEAAAALVRYKGDVRLEKAGDAVAIAVERMADHRMIASLTLWRNPEHRQSEIGYMLHPDAQGRGYASEAVSAMIDLAFGTLDVHRVYARLDARNGASAAVVTRLGFRQEAHLRENEWFKGEWSDELVFGILAREWSAARG